MRLTPSTRLGQYEISAQIGAGGMGEDVQQDLGPSWDILVASVGRNYYGPAHRDEDVSTTTY